MLTVQVLSIAKALPLQVRPHSSNIPHNQHQHPSQVHPNKELATKLHEQDPEQFTDSNHKPEIAVALGPFEAFVGWKPLSDIEPVLALQPLQHYHPDTNAPFDNAALKKVVKKMLTDSDENIAKAQKELLKLSKEELGKAGYIHEMLPRLQKQYSADDPGNLVALYVNPTPKLPSTTHH